MIMTMHPYGSRIPRSFRFLCASFLSLAGLVLATSAQAERATANWPQWRGPTGNGLVAEGNPPLEWSEEKNIKWKVQIPGSGHATPAIWENKIFVLTAVPVDSPQTDAATAPPRPAPADADGRRRRRGPGGGGGRPNQTYAFTVLCLDRTTGKVLWERIARRDAPHQTIQTSNTYCSGSPVTDGERVYAYFGSYGLYCYDMDGKLVWDKDLGKVNVRFGEGSSPALAGDVLVVLQDNDGPSCLYAFDKKTGRELWKKTRDEGAGWTTPYFVRHGGHTQVVVNGSNAIRAYDLATGDLLWQCSGLGSNPIPMVVSDESAVYAMSGHRNGAALAIELGNSGDLTGTKAVRWKTDRGTPYVPSPLLYDGLLFFCQRNSAILTCLDAATGKPYYTEERLEGVSGVYASPVGINNRIYWPGQNGLTLVLEKSKDLKILARNKLDDGFDASPAMVGNELFLRGRRHLYCIASSAER